MNNRPNSTVLGRLRAAVQTVRLLLRHLPYSWSLIPALRPGQPRRLALSDRRSSGLIAAFDDGGSESEYYEALSAASSTASSPTAGAVLHRKPSSLDSPAAGDVDIDTRAEDFIEQFHRQLRMEKQVSLELRYCRGRQYSFGSNYSIEDSPSSLSLSSSTC